MDRKIGTLGLVNYRNHPSDNRYKVFAFYKEEEAELFESTLNEMKVWFEKDEEDLKGKKLYMFAVDQLNFNKAQKANYKVSAAFRKPIIKNGFLRYGLLIIVFGAIGLGIYGYVKNMQKLDEKTIELNENEVNSSSE